MGKVYDTVYKTEVCKRVVGSGETVAAVSRELRISEITLHTWASRYREKVRFHSSEAVTSSRRMRN